MNCKVSGDNPERVGKLLSDVEVVVVERYQAQPDNFLEKYFRIVVDNISDWTHRLVSYESPSQTRRSRK